MVEKHNKTIEQDDPENHSLRDVALVRFIGKFVKTVGSEKTIRFLK